MRLTLQQCPFVCDAIFFFLCPITAATNTFLSCARQSAAERVPTVNSLNRTKEMCKIKMAQKEKVDERAACPGRIQNCSDAVTEAVFYALNHPGWI